MFRVAKGILYDQDECKDVVSDVFAKVFEEDILLDRLMLLIEHLEPPIRRQILRLRHVQGLPFQRIADDLGVSRVTVYHHLSEAINIIKRQLNQARQ